MDTSLVRAGRRRLGADLEVGPLGFGCWRLVAMGADDAQRRVESALEAGLDLVDTADVYGLDWGGEGFGAAEALLGRVLRQASGLRERMVLATKGGIRPGTPYDSSASHLVAACEASLERLGVEQVDLYQIHRPDLFGHPAEVAEAFERLRRDGKVREFGVSNHTPAQVEALASHLPFPLASQQPEFSVACLAPMRDGTFDQCLRLGLVPLAWSPLAGGRVVTGEGLPPDLLTVLDRLARREGVDRAAVALAFVLAHPAAPVALVGSTDPGRIRGAAASRDVRLDRQDLYALLQASEGAPLP